MKQKEPELIAPVRIVLSLASQLLTRKREPRDRRVPLGRARLLSPAQTVQGKNRAAAFCQMLVNERPEDGRKIERILE